MEQFVLIAASVYNNSKNLKTQTVKKQKHPKYQAEQKPTYQTDSSKKKETKQKLFAKAHTLVDKNFSCPHVKHSNSHTLKLEGVETGILVFYFAQQFFRKNADVPDIYFTLLDAAGISQSLVVNQNANAK